MAAPFTDAHRFGRADAAYDRKLDHEGREQSKFDEVACDIDGYLDEILDDEMARMGYFHASLLELLSAIATEHKVDEKLAAFKESLKDAVTAKADALVEQEDEAAAGFKAECQARRYTITHICGGGPY